MGRWERPAQLTGEETLTTWPLAMGAIRMLGLSGVLLIGGWWFVGSDPEFVMFAVGCCVLALVSLMMATWEELHWQPQDKRITILRKGLVKATERDEIPFELIEGVEFERKQEGKYLQLYVTVRLLRGKPPRVINFRGGDPSEAQMSEWVKAWGRRFPIR